MGGRSPLPIDFGCIGKSKAALWHAGMYFAGKCFCRMNEIIVSAAMSGQFPCGVQHGIGYRADVRVNSPEVAQHVEMKRGGLDGLGSTFTEALQMPFGRGKLGLRSKAFSARSLRASLTSPDMNTPKATRSVPCCACGNAESLLRLPAKTGSGALSSWLRVRSNSCR